LIAAHALITEYYNVLKKDARKSMLNIEHAVILFGDIT